MTDRQTFKVSEINPNPYRNIESYPYIEEKIKQLRESIRSTGFWDNLVGRINDEGEPEIAYGHHRIKAVEEELGSDAEVTLTIRDLSDDDMIRIMARENMEEWGSSVWVEMETVKSAVEAHAEDRIELPEVPENVPQAQRRYAPGFIQGGAPDGRALDPARAYTGTTLARFLGWHTTRPGGRTRPSNAVRVALSALEMVEAGVLEEDDLRGLSREAAIEAIRAARSEKRRKEKAAELHEREAEEADEQAERTQDPEARERARRRAESSREKAKRLREEGKKAERNVAKKATKDLREGEIGTKKVRTKAREYAGGEEDEKERIVHAHEVASNISTSVVNVFDPQRHSLAEKIEELIRLRAMLDEEDRERIARNLERVAERAKEYAERMREEVTEEERQELLTD